MRGQDPSHWSKKRGQLASVCSTIRQASLGAKKSSRDSPGICGISRGCGTDFLRSSESLSLHVPIECHFGTPRPAELVRFVGNHSEKISRLVVKSADRRK